MSIIRRHISVIMIAVAIMLQLSSCLKNEVDVEIKLPSSVTDAYRLQYYASDPAKGWYVDAAMAVDKGVGKTKVITRNPAIVSIMHGSNEMEAAFYAERGDKIEITGESSNPYSWKIKGNKISEEWSDWRIANQSALQGKDALKINEAVKTFVLKNKDNQLSTILLLLYFDRRKNNEEFLKLWNSLEGNAQSLALINLIGRSDLKEGKPLLPEATKELIVKTRDTGVDTIQIGKTPLLLLFTRTSDSEHDEAMLELRRLRKLNSDSANFRMAELSFDLDSMTWSYRQNLDSLSGVVRGWIPRGETDSVVNRLGVERTPFIIVFDKKGKALYRGENTSEGFTKYEKLISSTKDKKTPKQDQNNP